MSPYKLVAPADFLPEHHAYINKFKNHLHILDQNGEEIRYLLDVNHNIIAVSEGFAHILGWQNTEQAIGSCIPDAFKEDAQKCLDMMTPLKDISSVQIYECEDRVIARSLKTNILFDEDTKSVLGVIGTIHDTDINALNDVAPFQLIPEYLQIFAATGSTEIPDIDADLHKLTEEEKEICFLLLQNWDYEKIGEFMQEVKNEASLYTESYIADTIVTVSNKLNIDSNSKQELCKYLFAAGLQREWPEAFFSKMIGSTALN